MANRYKILCPWLDAVTSLKLIYDDGTLIIQGVGSDEKIVVNVIFCDVLMVRVSDEGVRLKLLNQIDMVRAFLFIDLKSDLIAWLAGESMHTRELAGSNHYVFLTREEIVDVVSFSDPQLENMA